VADASYPDDLKYHAEHDWARVDGDTATLGITWYAQDQLGEVVFFDPLKDSPEQINDDSYGNGWLVKVKLSDPSELDALMDSEKYQASLS
jgi:glycine cleavage system H protein